MRSKPHRAKSITNRRKWGWVGLAAAVLAAGAVLLLGQSPQPAQPPASSTQANVTPAQAPTQAAANPAQTQPPAAPTPAQAAAPNPQNTPAPAVPGQKLVAMPAAPPAAAAPLNPLSQETADLLKMATDLEDEINKTRPATLSLAVVRKASEIEQLAKKMKTQP